jgi:hypothetical protein
MTTAEVAPRVAVILAPQQSAVGEGVGLLEKEVGMHPA